MSLTREELREVLSDLEGRLDGRFNNLEERLDGRFNDVEERLDGRVHDLKEHLERLDGRFNDLRVHLDGRFNDVEELVRGHGDSLDLIATTVPRLRTLINDHEARIKRLEAALAG